MKQKDKKNKQLGMNFSTASNKLRKRLLFALVQDAGLDRCFRCDKRIEREQDLSIEHKEPWLDSEDPVGKFFDLENITFSHLSCNSGAARKTYRKYDTPEERLAGRREIARRHYSTERRQRRYKETGH